MEKPKFLGGTDDHSVPSTNDHQQQKEIEKQFLQNHAQIGRRELDTDTRIMILAEQVRLLFVRLLLVSQG